MCDKAVDTYLSTIKFVPQSFMTQEMCDKAVNICFFVFDSIPDQYKTQEMYERVVSEGPFFYSIFIIVYYSMFIFFIVKHKEFVMRLLMIL